MSIQFATPTVSAEWANSRETHPAVAMAIHAISDNSRSPEAIWEAPTSDEFETVACAVENYTANGVFEAEDDGRYQWGDEIIVLDNAGVAG
jgi:hypothetical protein